MKTLCRTCALLRGCKRLTRKVKGVFVFDYEKLKTEDSTDACSGWAKAGEDAIWMRESQIQMFGNQVLEALNSLPRDPKEEMDVEIPEFQKWLKKGVTYKERESQLRYETDNEGALALDPTGAKIPRTSYALRKYATDPEGPIKLSARMVMEWSPKTLIEAILKAEKEQGLVLTPQEKRKILEGDNQKETDMPVTNRVNMRRGGQLNMVNTAPTSGGQTAVATPAAVAQTQMPAPMAQTPLPIARTQAASAAPSGGVVRRPATARVVPQAQGIQMTQGAQRVATPTAQVASAAGSITRPVAAAASAATTVAPAATAAEIDYSRIVQEVTSALQQPITELTAKVNAVAETVTANFEYLQSVPNAITGDTLQLINILHDLLCTYFNVDNTVLVRNMSITDLIQGPDEPEANQDVVEGNA